MPDSPVKRKYRLLPFAGIHVEPNKEQGQRLNPQNEDIYRGGDTIETTTDMIEKFPGKWEEVIDKSKPVSPARKAAVDVLINATDKWKEKDRNFLEQMDKGQFETIVALTKPPEEKMAAAIAKVKEEHGDAAEETEEESKEEEKEEPGKPSIYGDDITNEFEIAGQHELKVYRNRAGRCQVVKPGTRKPLNDAALSMNEVEKFIEHYVKRHHGK